VQQAQHVCAVAVKIVLTLKDRIATAHTQTVTANAPSPRTVTTKFESLGYADKNLNS
jgi:hypothetical protein